MGYLNDLKLIMPPLLERFQKRHGIVLGIDVFYCLTRMIAWKLKRPLSTHSGQIKMVSVLPVEQSE